VRLFLDLHGHALKPGAFFYGCGASDIQQALLPRIASLGSRDICFPSSRFKFAKAHSKTARAVVFRHFGISASYTIEASFMGSVIPETDYDASSTCFTCFRVETIGLAVGRAMAVFFGIRGLPRDPTNPEVVTCTKNGEEQDCGPVVDDLLLNPEVYPAIGVFSGEEEKCCPWLMFDEFRKMTAEAVLADMMASGSSMRELLNHEEGAGSDSNPSDDNKDDDEGSSSRRARDRAKGGAVTPRGKARRTAGARKGSGNSPLGPERDRLRATNCRQTLVAKTARRARASPLPPEEPRARPPVLVQVAGSPSARSPSAVAEVRNGRLLEPALRQSADLSDGGGEGSAVSQGVASRSDSPLSAPKSPLQLKTHKDAEAIGILRKPFAKTPEAKQGREAIHAVISAAQNNLVPNDDIDAKVSSDGDEVQCDGSNGWPSNGIGLRRCLSAVSSVGRGEGDPTTPVSSDVKPIAENPAWFTANEGRSVFPGPDVVTLDLGIQPRESLRPPNTTHSSSAVNGASRGCTNSGNRPTNGHTASKRSCSPASPSVQQTHSSTKRGHDSAKIQENRRQWRGASHSLKLSGLALPKSEQSSLNIPSSWKRMGSSQSRNPGHQAASPAGSPQSVSARHGSHWPQVGRESEQAKRAASSRPSSRQRSRAIDESAVIHVHGPESGLPRVVGDQLSSRGPRRYLRTLGD